MLDKIIIASSNQGKVHEIHAAFSHISLTLKTQDELNINGAEEPFASFIENALAKARHTAKASNSAALADDSGLVVPALNNQPGVLSARYSGFNATDKKNNTKLLDAMQDVEDRRAYYYASMVLVLHADDPAPIIAEGYWHGQIYHCMQGENGFGYDPLFYDLRARKTAAQMTLAEKQQRSHRGQSLRRLLRLMRLRRLL